MPLVDPEVYTIAPIQARIAGWEANVQANFQALTAALKTFDLTIDTQGDTATPSILHIQTKDLAGEDVTGRVGLLRVRVADIYATAANATIAATGGTTLMEAITADKDLVLQSDADGLFEIELTDATPESVAIWIGPPPLGDSWISGRGAWQVTHAAP